MKTCTHCLLDKSDDKFGKTSQGTLRSWCRECANEESKIYHKTHPERHRIANKKWASRNPSKVLSIRRRFKLRKYGITEAEYGQILQLRGGVCAICKKPAHFRIDHCHRTGVVRGLLCHPCNTILGLAKDNPKVFEAAKAYLNSFILCERLSQE